MTGVARTARIWSADGDAEHAWHACYMHHELRGKAFVKHSGTSGEKWGSTAAVKQGCSEAHQENWSMMRVAIEDIAMTRTRLNHTTPTAT
jgi:hypothetical protein